MISSGKFRLDARLEDDEGAQAAQRFASQLIRGLGEGESLDATAVLAANPALGRYKSVVIDLAYEEFCRRRDAGEQIDRESFARRFPDYRFSLVRLLEVHSAFDKREDLLKNVQLRWPEPGEAFLGFELREELGQGAFSHVYLATEPKVGRRAVVVKVCVYGDYEVEALAGLQHDNIVPVFSVERDADSSLTAICMPYLGRVTLFDVLDHAYGRDRRRPSSGSTILETLEKHNLSPQQPHQQPSSDQAIAELGRRSYVEAVAGIGLQLADALDYTHRMGLCHGDIKPSNVLITPEGKAMLFDFNLAFAGGSQSRIGGTLPYMAPEQIQATLDADGRDVKVDARSDLYSFGAMLYELLTGELPFGPMPQDGDRRRTAAELLQRQKSGPRPVRKLNPHVDAALARIIQRCLAYDPAARYQSARALALALRGSKSQGLLARWGISRRQALLRAAAAAASVPLAALAAAYFVPRSDAVIEGSSKSGANPASEGDFASEAYEAFLEERYSDVIALLEPRAAGKQFDNNLRKMLARSYMHRARINEDFADYERAAEQFEIVDKSTATNAAVKACLAVCRAYAFNTQMTQEDRFELVELLRSAKEGLGPTPEFDNDLAYCLLSVEQTTEAKSLLRGIVEAGRKSDATSAAAYLNLGWIECRAAINNSLYPSLLEFEEARKHGVENRELHLLGMNLHAAGHHHAPDDGPKEYHYQQALVHLLAAGRLGAAQHELMPVHYLLPQLNDDFRVAAAVRRAPKESEKVPTSRLVDPLSGRNEPLEVVH